MLKMKLSLIASLAASAVVGSLGADSAAWASSIAMPRTWNDFTASPAQGDMASLFREYTRRFAKKYGSSKEEDEHFSVFQANVKSIFDFNSEKGHSYTKGITKFTDMSAEERRSYVMPETKATTGVRGSRAEPASKTIVNSGNWNMNSQTCDLRPFATSVKDQASCGSCWAFGTAAAAEGSHFLWSLTDATGHYSNNVDNSVDHYKDAAQVSEQAIMECCTKGNNGCGGGGTFEPLACAVQMGALPSVISHPYLADNNNFTCATTKSQAAVNVDSWYQPCNLDEKCLKSYIGGDSCDTFAAVAMKTSIEVISSFYDYVDGVYSDASCPTDIHNHAVTIVGWGTDAASGKDYWIIRNSWGPDWGAGGYIYMERGVNMCCVACDNLFFQ